MGISHDIFNAPDWVCDLMKNASKQMYPLPISVECEQDESTVKLVKRYIPYGRTERGIYHVIAIKENVEDAWQSCNTWQYISGGWVEIEQDKHLPKQTQLF